MKISKQANKFGMNCNFMMNEVMHVLITNVS